MSPTCPKLRAFVNTPSGPVPLTGERAKILLPRDPEAGPPELRYGPYLSALSDFLETDSWSTLRTALSALLAREVELREVLDVELISEKHGALYNVSHVRTRLSSGEIHHLVVNAAVTAGQHAFMENEVELLLRLFDRFGLPYLPRPLLSGETPCTDAGGGRLKLKLFLADWFEGFHEFHLSHGLEPGSPILKVWDPAGREGALDAERAGSLYSRAAGILTAYFDERSFQQIYPWHHAAGDFVLKPQDHDVELRLITARDYRCLVQWDGMEPNLWTALVHFFLNLTIRLRIDRLDGTGDLAWASPTCMPSIVSGFLDAWERKAGATPSLPSREDVRQALRSFTIEEWRDLTEIVMEDGLVEFSETSFLASRMGEHIAALRTSLHGHSLSPSG